MPERDTLQLVQKFQTFALDVGLIYNLFEFEQYFRLVYVYTSDILTSLCFIY